MSLKYTSGFGPIAGLERRLCRRGDLCFRVERRREYVRAVAPESPVRKESGRGRLRMLLRAWKEADGVGRLRRRIAAIVW
jgi:hypothetical protein